MTEISRRLEEALTDLAEHYEAAMMRQAEQNERLAAQNERLKRQVRTLRETVARLDAGSERLRQQVTNLARDYAGSPRRCASDRGNPGGAPPTTVPRPRARRRLEPLSVSLRTSVLYSFFIALTPTDG